MTDTGPSTGNTSLYRFAEPGGTEIETRAFDSDDAAESYARELPKARETPIIIERHNHVDWEYITEVDERP